MTTSTAIVKYVDELELEVKAKVDAVAAPQMLVAALALKVENAEQYAECGEILKGFVHKLKVLEEERLVSTVPLNKEVKRINDWYRPASSVGEQVVARLKRLMADYEIQQRNERRRLEAEAQAAAQKLLATAPDVTVSAGGKVSGAGAAGVALLVKQADAAMPEKVVGVASKPVWTFVVFDAMLLTREFLKPDLDALKKHVKEHGDQNVPAGVTVTEDIAVRMSPGARAKKD